MPMFPSFLIRPEIGLIATFNVYLVIAFGYVLHRFKKTLFIAILLTSLIVAFRANAFMAAGGCYPHACGAILPNATTNTIGNYYPWGGYYYAPQSYYPWMNNPYSMMGMAPSYYGQCMNCMTGSPNSLYPPGVR
jgi:hypothetical protein